MTESTRNAKVTTQIAKISNGIFTQNLWQIYSCTGMCWLIRIKPEMISLLLALTRALCITMHHYQSAATHFFKISIQHLNSCSTLLLDEQWNSGQLTQTDIQDKQTINAVEVPRKMWHTCKSNATFSHFGAYSRPPGRANTICRYASIYRRTLRHWLTHSKQKICRCLGHLNIWKVVLRYVFGSEDHSWQPVSDVTFLDQRVIPGSLSVT